MERASYVLAGGLKGAAMITMTIASIEARVIPIIFGILRDFLLGGV